MKFSIQLTKRDIFLSMMYNTYKNYAGISSILAGVLIIVMANVLPGIGDGYRAVLVILGIILPVSKPLSLYWNAKKAAQKMENSQKRDVYCLDDEKLKIVHGGKDFQIEWNRLYKVKEFQEYIYIYASRLHFMVIPKRELSEDINEKFQKILLDKNVKIERVKNSSFCLK